MNHSLEQERNEHLVQSMMIIILQLLNMHKHTIIIQAHSINELTELGNMIIRLGTRNGIYLTGWQNSKNTRTITFQDSQSMIVIQAMEAEGENK